MKELIPNLQSITDGQRATLEYFKADKAQQKGMVFSKAVANTDQFNFVTSAWDSAVVQGVQKHLPGPTCRRISEFYAGAKRFQNVQDAQLVGQMFAMRQRYRRDWSSLTPIERREMEEWMILFFSTNAERLQHSSTFVKRIDEILKAKG